MLIRPGEWHGTWVSWNRAGDFVGWYVNFQRPFTRTCAAIQTMDLALDFVVDRDLGMHTKDEDEFEALVAAGCIDTDESAHVREDAERMTGAVKTAAWPFDGAWLGWRPDPAWEPPRVRNDWHEVMDPFSFR